MSLSHLVVQDTEAPGEEVTCLKSPPFVLPSKVLLWLLATSSTTRSAHPDRPTPVATSPHPVSVAPCAERTGCPGVGIQGLHLSILSF